jgi:hypothetical protein
MANAALKEEELVIPAGGIADFYLDDDEFEAMNRADAEREFGGAGIANFQAVASRMASYGRYGDDKLVHAETGELIVPKALIEDNPQLRDSIFNHLRNMGIEDPERYVVGSDANSINPDTGLPEFFLKKIFKKVKKAVKKVVKSVKKVVKKVAPIVLPIVGSMFLGPIYGAAFGSGIATLINGGDLKDAFKSALISGGTGALFSGVSGAISGEGFMSGVSNAANPANLTEGFSNIGKAFTGDFSGASFGNMKGGPASEGGTNFAGTSESALSTSPSGTPTSVSDVNTAAAIDPATGRPPVSAGTPNNMSLSNYDPATGTFRTPTVTTDSALTQAYQPSTISDTVTDMFTDIGTGDKSFLDASKELFMPAGPSEAQVALAKNTAYGDAFNAVKALPGATDAQAAAAGLEAMKNVTASSIGPGLLRTYGPAAAAGTAIAAGAGFFDAPEEPPVDIPPTGEELIAADPDKYRISDLEVRRSEGPTEVESPYTIVPGQGTFVNPFYRPQLAAEGGEIFPRRVGGIMPDEGVPGKDSVRAMLMPGEFVMTTDAVRGLGNGDNEQGIRNMYDMMRGLEAKGRAMA